jgi:hypothetical protein
MKAGKFIWEGLPENMKEHERYGNRAFFIRLGWVSKLEEIEHRQEKDLDFYFFGSMSPRRQAIVKDLWSRGFIGGADHSCPAFLRNDRIARARVQLNLVLHDQYTHVNALRIMYLANNRCAILSEAENDPAGYLSLTKVVSDKNLLGDALQELVTGNKWKQLAEESYEKCRAHPMKASMERLLEESFGS